MCKFCENAYKDRRELKLGDIFISQYAKYTEIGDGRERYIPMKYCPNCGEKFDKEKK